LVEFDLQLSPRRGSDSIAASDQSLGKSGVDATARLRALSSAPVTIIFAAEHAPPHLTLALTSRGDKKREFVATTC
jgi:hypothetical protein